MHLGRCIGSKEMRVRLCARSTTRGPGAQSNRSGRIHNGSWCHRNTRCRRYQYYSPCSSTRLRFDFGSA